MHPPQPLPKENTLSQHQNLPTNILSIYQTKVLTESLYLVKVENVILLLYQFSELK